jgi:hypothetical protein
VLALFLLPGSLAVSGHDIGRNPAALLDIDALVLGSCADRVGVEGARVPGAAADPAGAGDLAGMSDVGLQGLHLLGHEDIPFL